MKGPEDAPRGLGDRGGRDRSVAHRLRSGRPDPAGSHRDAGTDAGADAEGWYDSSHLVVADSPSQGGLRVVDLQGKGGSTVALTHGDLVGVIS